MDLMWPHGVNASDITKLSRDERHGRLTVAQSRSDVLTGIMGRGGMDGLDDLGVVDALQVDRREAEVAVAELALDDDQRHAFARELDGLRLSWTSPSVVGIVAAR
jgi:hypothetical protein